jgi:hypothetical protein
MSFALETLDQHYDYVAEALGEGSVVPLLGAGANLCDPARHGWREGENLPDGGELSRYLAAKYHYPAEDAGDLLRVSQYAQAMRGDGTLYKSLHRVFAADYGYTVVHEFLARLPSLLEQAGGLRRHQLIVSTNYDDALEQALTAANEPFELVWYCPPDQRSQGTLMHKPPDGEPTPIERPNEYHLPVEGRTVILKIHGAVSRTAGVRDSYVISEDDYIRFMAETTLQELIPATLLATLLNSHILFLGYSLRDWNLRVILQQISAHRDRELDSWAIQKDVDDIDRALWDCRKVRLQEVALDSYVSELSKRISTPNDDQQAV